MSGYRAISASLAEWTGSISRFTATLDAQGHPYISYSKLATVEFCQYRYLLEYVKKVRLRPQPSYFVKGQLFHDAAARVYRSMADQKEVDVARLHARIDKRADSGDAIHLKNAVQLSVTNAFKDWEIIGIEQPFVLSMGEALPPLLGVIDLVLRKGPLFAVIDHKTGKAFNKPEPLQLAVYRQHVVRKYRTDNCVAFYDEYRWVENLARIRKPAFQRTEVKKAAQPWDRTLKRFVSGYRKMRRIEEAGDAEGGGLCFVCPFRDQCPKASIGFGG